MVLPGRMGWSHQMAMRTRSTTRTARSQRSERARVPTGRRILELSQAVLLDRSVHRRYRSDRHLALAAVQLPNCRILLAPVFWFIIIVPDILVYIGIHLRYDTTWYVLSDRTLRIRRGIWIINEVTITYENIQNVSVRQGPIQRAFGISDLVVQTAGGGGAVGGHGEQNLSGHMGLLEGIDNAEEVRELIMDKWRAAKSAGLGDEGHRPALSSAAELEVLAQIRDLAVQLSL